MRKGWVKGTLGAVCEIQSGAGFPNKLQGQVGQKFPFYKVSDMNLPGNETFMVSENNSVSDAVRKQLRARTFPKGSVIFPKIGGAIATNKKRRVLKDCCVDNNVMGLIPKHEHIDADYLFYFMESLNGIAAAIAKTEKNLANARELFESYRDSVITEKGRGWIEKPLADLCDIKHGFAFKSEYFTDTGDYILLTPGNFYETGGYRDRGEKQKYYCGEIPEGFILSPGDLLVAMTEQAAGLLGSPIIVPESGIFLHNQRLGLVTKKPGVKWLNEFFFHVFNTKPVRREIHDSASGVKVRHTSPAKVGAVVVAFPASIPEQQIIVAKVNQLASETQHLEAIYQRKVSYLLELKQSLLRKAFAGELTAQPEKALQKAIA